MTHPPSSRANSRNSRKQQQRRRQEHVFDSKSKRAPDSETRERDFVSLGTTSSGDNNRPNRVRENHADLPILEKGEMDHSWREDGVRDATETSERANRCDASVRGDFFLLLILLLLRNGVV